MEVDEHTKKVQKELAMKDLLFPKTPGQDSKELDWELDWELKTL